MKRWGPRTAAGSSCRCAWVRCPAPEQSHNPALVQSKHRSVEWPPRRARCVSVAARLAYGLGGQINHKTGRSLRLNHAARRRDPEPFFTHLGNLRPVARAVLDHELAQHAILLHHVPCTHQPTARPRVKPPPQQLYQESQEGGAWRGGHPRDRCGSASDYHPRAQDPTLSGVPVPGAIEMEVAPLRST